MAARQDKSTTRIGLTLVTVFADDTAYVGSIGWWASVVTANLLLIARHQLD